MGNEFEEADFVDHEFRATQKAGESRSLATTHLSGHPLNRPPTREELDSKVGETLNKLAELKRAQESLERERSALEEARRRQMEFLNGREEMLQHLTRGIGLLSEAEFNARRDAEQMAKTLAGFREALGNVQGINPDSWTTVNCNVELTKALTAIENARMEWNSALLKWPILSGNQMTLDPEVKPAANPFTKLGQTENFWHLCKIGLALTWPVALAVLGVLTALCVILARR